MSDELEQTPPKAGGGAEPLLVRVEEAARILSLSRSTVYKMMNSGELASVRWGSARRVVKAAVHAWIAHQTTPASTP